MAVVTDEGASTLLDCGTAEATGRVEEETLHQHRPASQHCPGSLGAVSDVMLITIWLALVTGGAEGLYWLARQQLAGAMVFIHPGFLWMSPLAQLAIFILPGLGLTAIAWYSNSARILPFSVTFLSLIGWLNGVQLLFPQLHFWAWIILACGLATATGRLFQRYAGTCVTVIRRTTSWLILFFVLIALGQGVSAWHRENSAVAALPSRPASAPNVLLIVLDTVRADALRAVGSNRELAPNLAKISERGVVCETAWSTAPWTLPSQAGMFTGRLPHELSSDWLSKLDATYPTLAEELSARGWLTGGFVGNTRYCSAETGLGRGFTHYEGYRLSWADLALCTALGRKLLCSSLPVQIGLCDWPARKRAPEVNASFLTWLDRRQGRPFFAFLNYWDVHDPYFAPSGFRTHMSADLRDTLLLRNWWWGDKQQLSRDQIGKLREAYEDCIRGLDHHIGQLFEELERRGELENTLLIITSDHGEHFAEHELFLHGNSLYEPLLHVPLILVWPDKIPAGRRVDAPVSLQGLPNTVLELLGQQGDFPGRSWLHHWTEQPTNALETESLFAEIGSQAAYPPCHGRSPVAAGAMQCVRVGMMKYIHNGDGVEELYDLASDPQEQDNLAQDPHHRQLLLRMREALGPS